MKQNNNKINTTILTFLCKMEYLNKILILIIIYFTVQLMAK